MDGHPPYRLGLGAAADLRQGCLRQRVERDRAGGETRAPRPLRQQGAEVHGLVQPLDDPGAGGWWRAALHIGGGPPAGARAAFLGGPGLPGPLDLAIVYDSDPLPIEFA